MSAEPKRYRLDEETRAKPLLEEAKDSMVIVELDGDAYEVNIRAILDANEVMEEGQPFTMDDPLWSLVGTGRSEGPTDVARNKHKYVADAIYAESHPQKGTMTISPPSGSQLVFVDTGAFYALLDPRDDVHQEAQAVLPLNVYASTQATSLLLNRIR